MGIRRRFSLPVPAWDHFLSDRRNRTSRRRYPRGLHYWWGVFSLSHHRSRRGLLLRDFGSVVPVAVIPCARRSPFGIRFRVDDTAAVGIPVYAFSSSSCVLLPILAKGSSSARRCPSVRSGASAGAIRQRRGSKICRNPTRRQPGRVRYHGIHSLSREREFALEAQDRGSRDAVDKWDVETDTCPPCRIDRRLVGCVSRGGWGDCVVPRSVAIATRLVYRGSYIPFCLASMRLREVGFY